MSAHQKVDTVGATRADALAHLADLTNAHNITYLIPADYPNGAAPIQAKGWIWERGKWNPKAAENAGAWLVKQARIENVDDVLALGKRMSRMNAIAIYGQRNDTPAPLEYEMNHSTHLTPPGYVTRDNEHFDCVARAYLILDVDKSEITDRDPATAATKMRALMAEPFRNAACVFGATAGHGMKPSARMRLIFMLTRVLYPHASFDFAQAGCSITFDASLRKHAQPIYMRNAYLQGKASPVDFERWGKLDGEPRVVVPADLPNPALPAKQAAKPANLNMKPNTARGFDHFVDATIRRPAPGVGARKTTVDLIAKDARQAALDFDVAESLAHAYLAPSDETQSEAEAMMKGRGYAKATEAALHLREAGDAIADAWEDRDPLDDWNDYAVTAYNAARWGNFMGEKHTLDDGEDFGTPDLSEEGDDVTAEQTTAEPSNLGAAPVGLLSRQFQKAAESGDNVVLLETARALHDKAARLRREDARVAYADVVEAIDPKDGIRAGEAEIAAAVGAAIPFAKGSVSNAAEPGKAPEKMRKRFPPLTPFRISADVEIAPRRFIHNRDYLRGFVFATIAPGGRGKSSLLLAEAVSMACGVDIYGRPCKKLNVFYFNAEDPEDEIKRRTRAIMKLRGISVAALGDRLMIVSGRDMPIKLAEMRDGRPTIRADAEALEALLHAHKIDVAMFDPFVSIHLCSENDTTAIDLTVKELGRIAGATDAAIMLAHHTRKPGTDGASGGQITTDDSRGAKALIDACRLQRLLNPMTSKLAQQYEIGDADRWRYISVSDGKSNMSPKGPGAWYKLESQSLDNGTSEYEADDVGVAVGWLAPETVNRGTDDQEKVAGWLALQEPGAEIAVAKVCEATALPQKDFRRNILGGAAEVVTSHGKLAHSSNPGRAPNTLRLVALEIEDGEAFGVPTVDDVMDARA